MLAPRLAVEGIGPIALPLLPVEAEQQSLTRESQALTGGI